MWPIWPAADEVFGKRAGPPWPSGGRSTLCTARHLERVVLHQLDGQKLAPMVDDALTENGVFIGGDGGGAGLPLGEHLEKVHRLLSPSAKCLRSEGHKAEAGGLGDGTVLIDLVFLRKLRRLATWELCAAPVDCPVEGDGGVVRPAGVGDGDIEQVIAAVDHTVDVHTLAVGVVVGWGDTEAVQRHLHIGRNICLSQDANKQVAHIVVSRDPLTAGVTHVVVIAKLVNLTAADASLRDGCVREGDAETLGDGVAILEVVQCLAVAGRDRGQPARRERPLAAQETGAGPAVGRERVEELVEAKLVQLIGQALLQADLRPRGKVLEGGEREGGANHLRDGS